MQIAAPDRGRSKTDMKKLLSILISFLVFLVPAYAEQFDTKFSGALNTTITDVVTGGLWKQDQSYGSWRLVVKTLGWEHTRNYLYLQWLKSDDKNKKVIEYKTLPISEFNAANWHNVINIEYQNSSFTISYTVRGEDVAHTAILLPNSPGKYKIKLKE